MKVLHMISGGDVGGAKTHVHTLLAGLTKTENVLLACFMDGPFAREAEALGIPTQVFTGSIPSVVRQLTRLTQEQGFEILHCHGARANLIGSLLRRRTGLPTVSTVHSDYRLDYMHRPLAALTYGTLNKLALRRMDNWIGVSQTTAEMLYERGFDPNRTYVISNGVPFDLPAPALDRDSYLRSLGFEPKEDTVVFGIAARISPVKDMGTLIRAFAKVVRSCPSARLIIAGDGEERERMEALAAELCPAGTVAFAGWISDTHSFYSALDVNLLTSLSEGFPYALPEGASRRCATIATRVGGIPSLVEHESNGLLFTPKDVDTLASYMVRLAQDRELLKTYADRLYEKAKAEYSVEATVARQKEIYESILRRRARTADGKRDGVLICGAYGKGNSGDDAILTAIVRSFRAQDPDLPLYVTSRTPSRTARDTGVGSVYTFHPWKVRRRMRRTALYLSGGGSLIQDATSTRSLWYYLNSIRAAKRLGNPVMMFGCGIGPVRRSLNRRCAGRILQSCVDRITLRDHASLRELEALGVSGIPTRVTADLAFLVSPADPALVEAQCAAQGIAPEDRLLILAPRPWEGMAHRLEAFAEAAVYGARRKGYRPVLLAMEPAKDRNVCRQIAELAAAKGVDCPVLEASQDTGAVVGLIRRADAVLAMRLHALIFAAAQGTPFAGVAYDPKITGFMDYMGQGLCCALEEADASRLCGLMDRLEESGDFETAARQLRALAAENCAEAFDLMNAHR
ncbi:MAG: polysaccharide pyruvyl transferase CsaB [Oscillospiraceae bacterium]|nr:polysaccharide pyruvyl transferase CsaB [Oscillospiraceae bacterium]